MECADATTIAATIAPGSLADRAAALNLAERFEDAARVACLALAADPACVGAWCNLGNALAELQRHDDAIACYARALAVTPAHAPSLANMGVVLQARGAPDRATTFLELASALAPDDAETRCNLALALLADGRWARGFAEYEWRWRVPGALPCRFDPAARWRGERAPGATLLVHEEGGFGDAIQFVRFARAARARVGRLVLLVRPPLASLLSRVEGVDLVATDGDAVPPFDLHVPILSLAHATGADPAVPGFGAPYLETDPARDRAMGARLDAIEAGAPDGAAGGLRVGLVWAGSPRHGMAGAARADRRRSVACAALSPILDAAAPGTRFYGLQVGAPETACTDPRIADLSGALGSFDDTASAVRLLDLVIAVDTSTAHLAAALGREVWLLSRFDQCWRWMAGRDTSPWYDRLRIFRQPAPGDWDTPVRRVSDALAARSRQFGAISPSLA